jgi:hypothetical protein
MPAKRLWAALVLMIVVIGAVPAFAREIRQGDQCRVGAREVIRGDLFVLCRSLVIDGQVNGNVIGAATTAAINGEIEGATYIIAGQLDVGGTLQNTLHFLGISLNIGTDARLLGSTTGLMSASLSTHLRAGTSIPDSIVGIGYQLVLDGEVRDGVSFWGSALQVGGHVRGDVNASVGDSQSAGFAELQRLLTLLPISVELIRPGLFVQETAVVDGVLNYAAPTEGVIDAQLAHPPQFTQVIVQPDLAQIAQITEPEDAGREFILFAGRVLREFVTLVFVGVVALILIPGVFQAPLRSLTTRPLPSFGLGLLTFVVSFPVFFILLGLVVIAIFVLSLLQLGDITLASAVLLGSVHLGLTGVFYFIAIFVSRVMVCLRLGRLISSRWRTGARYGAYAHLALGALVLSVLFTLPVVGWLISAVTAFLGLGAVLTHLQSQMEMRRRPIPVRGMAAMHLPSRSEDARQFPPPMLDISANAPGMDNLPSGFRWWDDD